MVLGSTFHTLNTSQLSASCAVISTLCLRLDTHGKEARTTWTQGKGHIPVNSAKTVVGKVGSVRGPGAAFWDRWGKM